MKLTSKFVANASHGQQNADDRMLHPSIQTYEPCSSKEVIPGPESREEEVQSLARRFSAHSTTMQNPFAVESGSPLDPNGENFNARTWCKAMLQMHSEDSKAHPLRTLGVAFSNLNAYGFSSDTNYQKTVGNVWLGVFGLARKLMGQRHRRIDILQNLEGLVEAGELLAVLGPPGSGCSTFLKTIAGETHGFYVDECSKMNYQGTSRTLLRVINCPC